MIVLRGVAKAYRSTSPLTDVSASIGPGECVCIVGPSGSGKTTLLHLLLRSQDVTRGSIEVDGVDIRTLPLPILQLYRQRLGVAFQQDRLLDQLTVVENIALPLELRGWTDAAIQAEMAAILSRTELLPIARLQPPTLSVGQRRLVSIARACAGQPAILLLDEPFAALDAQQVQAALLLIRDAHARGATVIVFTQEAGWAGQMQARTLSLAAGTMGGDALPGHITAAQEHRVLRDDRPAAPADDEEPAAAASPTPAGDGARRIRITAINSDLADT